jgi:hypothetical protein
VIPPPRTLITIAVALVIASLIVWVVTRLPWARELGGTGRQRKLLAAILTAVLTAFLAWLLVIFPAYWD